MKKKYLVIAFVLISTLAIGQKKPKIKGSKNVVEINKTFPASFNAIEIDDALNVELHTAKENNYTLETDDNLVDIIQFKIIDSILNIYTSNKIVSNKKLNISINVTNLEHIILKNDASVSSKGKLESEKLYINCFNSSNVDLDVEADDVFVTFQRNAGGKLKIQSKNTTINMNDRSDLKASVSAKNLSVTLTKTAQLKIKGDADLAYYNLKDASELKADDLKATKVDLYTSNSADVYVYASRNFEVYAQGKSSVYLYGDPEIEVKGLTDSSKIIKKN